MKKNSPYRKAFMKNLTGEHHYPKTIPKRTFYKYYNSIKPKTENYIVGELLYFDILNRVNAEIEELLLQGNIIRLPAHFGDISIRMKILKLGIKDGKLYNRRPIDWEATLKLWYENEEAAAAKTLIKIETDISYKLHYPKHRAKYKNKSCISMRSNRSFRAKMNYRICNTDFQCFKLLNDGS